MRTRNSFLNFLANEGSHFINVVMSFVCRTVLIYTLSLEYVGINGLFGNILTVLSFAELGIGTAMIYKMYKPVAENDYQGIREFMNLYRKLYIAVAMVIAVAGLILVPFLPSLIKDYNSYKDLENLTVIYLLFLGDAVSSYFFSYKRSIIYAYQKMYITTLIDTIVTFLQFVIQIVVLVVFKKFVAYIIIQVISSFLKNAISAYVADKTYPFLKEDKKSLPSKEVRKDIQKNVGAMSLHKLGDIVVNNTDNLIMSAFVGVGSVAIYSNYILIQSTVNTALNGLFGAFTASIGNLGAEENSGRMYDIFKVLNFPGFWLYGFCTTAFLVLYNPFIENWAGDKYLFPMWLVFLIVIIFYLNGMRKVNLTFRDAMGLYWYDRYKPIAEIIINLTVSLYAVIKLGTAGIFIGTIVSIMTTCFWIEPLVTFKYGFKVPVREYFKKYGIYTLVTVIDGVFTYALCNYLAPKGWMGVVVRVFLCVIVYNSIVWALFSRTNEYKEIITRLKQTLGNMKKRG
ncbi:MAG: hypothetical protein K6F30_10240 [Lachnospiraceae bacterium]|nr:hypothetical protein [Lachnospiraceae bacterium]